MASAGPRLCDLRLLYRICSTVTSKSPSVMLRSRQSLAEVYINHVQEKTASSVSRPPKI